MAMPNESTLIHRETRALILLVVIAIGAFGFTRSVAHANGERRQRDALTWLARGRVSLESGQTAAAIQQLRRALLLEPANLPARLALATALTNAAAVDEARAVLSAAHTIAADNADVNLALARLEAGHGGAAATISAYQNVLNVLWHPGDAVSRYQVRLELARYLIAHEQRSRALSELLIVAADAPDTPEAHADVGRLLLAAGEPARALTQLQRSVALRPADQETQLAAGQAALAIGEDAKALRYLRRAGELAPARALAAVTTLVLASDPLLPRLTSAERERRLRLGLARVEQRLGGCAAAANPGTDITGLSSEVEAFEAALTTRARRRGPPVVDLLDDGIELIGRVEARTTACGPVEPLDEALTIIAHRHEAGA